MPNYSIKDKGNLAPYNLWSGGDYTKNTTGLSSVGGILEITSEYCTNGDYCILLNRSPDAINNTYLQAPPNLQSGDLNKTLTLTADIYSPMNDVTLQIYHDNGYFYTILSKNNSFQTVTVSKVITKITGLNCFINIQKGQNCYMDNIKLELQ